MALQLSYEDAHGSTHSSAYHRVTVLDLNYVSKSARVVVSIYVDSAARTAAKEPVAERRYRLREAAVDDMPTFDSVFSDAELDAVDETPLANAYTFLKTLDEYSGAQDV